MKAQRVTTKICGMPIEYGRCKFMKLDTQFMGMPVCIKRIGCECILVPAEKPDPFIYE